ncbi:MAG: hypothetical protein N3F07_00940 [Candidatus Micrarchaeota archaeon]|nr:hypothetical protein [Candidatus Micrarchaeota archaeon]
MILLPSAKQASASTQAPLKPMLHFLPEGLPRKAAEFLVAIIPGAILLFAFFIAAEATVAIFTGEKGNSFMSVIFLPVICLLPLLSGVVSALILEKLRRAQVSVVDGAVAGAASAMAGSAASSFVLVALDIALRLHPFGNSITGLMLALVMAFVVAMDTLLGAIGGGMTAKFLKDF